MQTFLPYANFTKSAQCLDYRRLGKQRVEVWQIYNTIVKGGGWRHHPIVKMWKGYEYCLLLYGVTICEEWINRGYKDTMLGRFELLLMHGHNAKLKIPKWLGNRKFHSSHRSNLLRKDIKYYGKFGWKEPDNLPYVWITNKKEV